MSKADDSRGAHPTGRGGETRRALTASSLSAGTDGVPKRSALDLLGLLRRVFTYARPYARKRNGLLVAVVLRALLLPAVAWAIGAAINGPITSGSGVGIFWATVGFAALVVAVQVGMHFRMRLALELGESVIHDLRREVFRHVLRMPMGFFDRSKAGQIIGRLTTDLDAVRMGVQDIVFISMVQGGQMLVTAALMAWLDWVLFLLVMAIAPVIWKLNAYFTRRITQQQRQQQESFGRVTSVLAESVNGIRVTQGFVRQEVNAGFFRSLITDHSRLAVGAGRTTAVFLPLLELNSQFFIALLVVVGGGRALDPEIARPVGEIVQFFFLANLFFDPIRVLGMQYNNALAAMVGAERVFSLLDTKADWEDIAEAKDLKTIAGRVEFRDLSFSYEGGDRREGGRVVLKGISFVAQPGETVALVGHTGSGKTSIINLVAKLYLPTAGTLLIDDRDVMEVTSESLHRQMGMVHQHSYLFGGTVMDNIRMARPEATDAEVVESVRLLDCLDLIEGLPQGFQTEVGEAGGDLSVGQRQLVAFARAMMADPRILILDEATSAIDAMTEARLQRALEKLLEGRTSFVVAHRLSTIRKANQILVLRQGEIVERGRHADLVAANGVYAELERHFAGDA
ncbi:MAG: ABC transporter ATP-binding protein [Chthoniobacterales bacterium]